MDPLAALDASTEPLLDLVSRIQPEQWHAPTPCTDWDVRTLVGHLIATMDGYMGLLHGKDPAYLLDLMAQQNAAGGDDPQGAFRTAVAATHTAFAQPGALARPVRHMIGDISGEDLLALRITENVIHGCDLATAIGVDVTFHPDVVELVYERLAPLAALLPIPGFFDAPTTPLPDNATRLQQVLHMIGR